MTLPHPHGDSSGQIAHNSNYDTGVTPGSTGGKFVGFGEEGTSAIVNRANWALSENINYLHTQLTQEIAIPYSYSRTAGAGETSFQFPTGEEVWVGDSSYPGSAGSSDAEGMMMLFSVLDDNHNELKDDNGNEIRVKIVRESTGVTDVYQGGNPFLDSFQDQPIIYFMAVDPVDGTVVTDPYTIPSGTDYRVLCGVKSTVLELPSDAFVRYKVQAASEVEAGDGPNIAEGLEVMTSNRCMDRTGTITAVGRDVTYPDLKVLLLGKTVYIPGGTIQCADTTGTHYLYVTPTGSVALTTGTWGDSLALPADGSVLIWRGDFAATPETWTGETDLRWPSNRQGNHTAVYVGSGVGADYTSLNDAIDWVRYTGLGVGKQNTNYEIVIVGEAEASSTAILPAGWTLRGTSAQGQHPYTGSVIVTSAGFTTTSTVVYAYDDCTIKDLVIKWGATSDQSTTASGLYIQSNCLVERVKFEKSATRFGRNITVNAATTDTLGPAIRECYFDCFQYAGVVAGEQGRVRVDNCTFVTDTASVYHIYLAPGDATGDMRSPGHTIFGCYFKGATSSAHILVGGPSVLVDSCQAELTGSAKPFVEIDGSQSQDVAGVTIRNCFLENGYTLLSGNISDTAVRLVVFVEGCICTGFTGTLCSLVSSVSDESSVVIDRNLFIGDGSTSEIGFNISVSSVRISNNKFVDWTKYAVSIDSTSSALENFWISDNHFYKCATKTATVDSKTAPEGSVIFVDVPSNSVKNIQISGNLFQDIDGHAIEFNDGGESITISNNVFDAVKGVNLYDSGGGTADMSRGCVIRLDDVRVAAVSGNRFTGCGFKHTISGVTIWNGIINVWTSVQTLLTVNDNDFGQSIPGSGNGSLTDSWYTLNINGSVDVMCSNNRFYQDIAGGTDAPGAGLLHVRKNGGGMLFMNGCYMTLTGDTTGGNTDGGYGCLAVIAVCKVFATGCYSVGDWSVTATTEYNWDLNSGIGESRNGCVVGCGFNGEKHVDISVDEGYTLGNFHVNAGLKNFVTEDASNHDTYPDSQTAYSSNTLTPNQDFNRKVNAV